MRRVMSIEETSRSTSMQVGTLQSSMGSSTINPTSFTTVSIHSSCLITRPKLCPDGGRSRCGKCWKKQTSFNLKRGDAGLTCGARARSVIVGKIVRTWHKRPAEETGLAIPWGRAARQGWLWSCVRGGSTSDRDPGWGNGAFRCGRGHSGSQSLARLGLGLRCV